MTRFVDHQRGAIAVMAALFVVVLIGFAALALDLGRLYVLRTEMQNAADAAAMAAAAELDARDNAIFDAKAAAREAFIAHQGRFANEPELLNILPDNAFEFYSWIGSENDGARPTDCSPTAEEPNKCPTIADDQAFYVKVKLYPELVDEGHYQISLFFLPVLGLILEDGVAQVASTRVSAVAGAGGPLLCNLPPVLVCDPAEAGEPFQPGQMVVMKEQGAGVWEPGNFGFLQPFKPITGNLNKDLSYQMANEDLGGCIEPYISTLTGGKTSYGRYGLNTRFGIYDNSVEDLKADFPPAPNVIDYPRDDNLTPAAELNVVSGMCTFPIDDKYGDNANTFSGAPYDALATTEVTGCASTYGLNSNLAGNTDADNDGWTGAGDPDDTNPNLPLAPPSFYNQAYHRGETVPTFTSRYEYYQWELGVNPVDPDPNNWQWTEQQFDINGINAHPPSISNELLGGLTESPCLNDEKCRIYYGDPETSMPAANDAGQPNRRIIYIAMLKCEELGITGNTPNIFVDPDTAKFAKFFLTEHAYPPPASDFYAEYIGEVVGEERQQIVVRNQVVLYE